MYQDTAPVEVERYHAHLRSLAPHERLRIAVALSTTVRHLAEAGLRLRHPDADARELQVRLVVRLHGRDTAMRVFGDVPDDAR